MNMPSRILVIGISGVTCGGKTTLAMQLNEHLPRCRIISQDDYFLAEDDQRHIRISELNHINFDILESLDMEKMQHDIEDYIDNKFVVSASKRNCDIESESADVDKNLLYNTIKESDLEILIIEGFSIFNYKPLRNVFHLQYYLTLTEEICHARRLNRVYNPPDCPGYFEKCVWPEHLKQLEEVKNEVEGVTYFAENKNDRLESVLRDIAMFVENQHS